MVDSNQCFYPGCTKKPDYVCYCEENLIMCNQHITVHMKEWHKIKPNFPYKSEESLQRLTQLKKKLITAKTFGLSRLLEDHNREIETFKNFIQKSTEEFHIQIKKISEKYDEIFEYIEILLNSNRIPENWTPEWVKTLINLDEYSLKYLCKVIEGKEKEHIFHMIKQNLFKINIKTQIPKRMSIKINPPLPIPLFNNNLNINTNSTLINWDKNTIFLLGGIHWSDCYKINKKKRDSIKIDGIPGFRTRLQGSTKFGNFIYVFGGVNEHGNSNECFFLDAERLCWNRISNLPQASERNSVIKVGKEILVTGFLIEGVYRYIPELDSFSLLFLDSKGELDRIIFKTSKKEVFLIVSGEFIYKSCREELGTWTKIGASPEIGWNVTDRCEN